MIYPSLPAGEYEPGMVVPKWAFEWLRERFGDWMHQKKCCPRILVSRSKGHDEENCQ